MNYKPNLPVLVIPTGWHALEPSALYAATCRETVLAVSEVVVYATGAKGNRSFDKATGLDTRDGYCRLLPLTPALQTVIEAIEALKHGKVSPKPSDQLKAAHARNALYLRFKEEVEEVAR